MTDERASAPGIDAFGRTDVGRVRAVNEDRVLVARLRKAFSVTSTNLDRDADLPWVDDASGHLLCVADGVSSSGAGSAASGLAVETMTRHVVELMDFFYGATPGSEDLFLERLDQAVTATHDRVREQGGATTMTLILLLWPRAYLVHLGDSRAYHLRGSRLRVLTRDQTLGNLLVDQGLLGEQEAGRAAFHKALGSALGGSFKPAIGLIDLEPGDRLLLCTDGLWRHVDDDRVGQLLAGARSAESACGDLVAAALAGGGSDNVAVAVLRCEA